MAQRDAGGYYTDRDDNGAVNQAGNAASFDEDRLLLADALVYGDVQAAHADVQEAVVRPLDLALDAGAGANENQPLMQFARQRREKPKVCSNKLITCYIILAVCLFLSILAVYVLVTTPSASQYHQIINQGLPDVLLMSIVSIVPSPAWLVKADLTFEKDCFGEYCHIPCDKLSPTHISGYELIERDYIYCLNNTVFNFTLNQTEFVSGNMAVWLIEGNPTTYPDPTGNCSTNPTIQGKQVCIELNFTHPSGTIEVWHEGIEGAYYYWRAWPNEPIDSIDAVIQDWYVYNITSCESSDSFNGVNSPIVMSYHEGFQPTNFTSPCLLVSINQTSNCEGIDIETHRRYDIVFWPGLAGILVIVTISVTGIIHAVYYFNQKNKYNRMQLQERDN